MPDDYERVFSLLEEAKQKLRDAQQECAKFSVYISGEIEDVGYEIDQVVEELKEAIEDTEDVE